MELNPGDKLGPYEILSVLGEGGMGSVYRANDPRLHREVAIKGAVPQNRGGRPRPPAKGLASALAAADGAVTM